MYRFLWLVAFLALGLASAVQAADPPRGLDIYFIDTEGGAATLIVTPAGESVLIDCGNPGRRDAERIHKVATEHAGLKALDHLAITHWHLDHYGGVERLSKLMPIHNYYDRGIPEKLEEDAKNFPALIRAYRTASRDRSTTVRPGDVLPLRQQEGSPALRLFCLCSAGDVLPESADAPANPIAKEHKAKPEDKTDNARSLGFLLSLGDFRFLDLGDLTWNNEHRLVAPSDRIGIVDVYQVTHHGLDISNNPVLMKTVKPTVAIYNNGPRKGCHPRVTADLRRIPEVKAIYQLHRNVTVKPQENTDPQFIANDEADCKGEFIKLSVAPDGKSYLVKVGSKGEHRYETKAAK